MEDGHLWLRLENWEKCKLMVTSAVVGAALWFGDVSQGQLRTIHEMVCKEHCKAYLQGTRDGSNLRQVLGQLTVLKFGRMSSDLLAYGASDGTLRFAASHHLQSSRSLRPF
ncbi:hypothetical protein IFM89_024551 [Coptis chinensis]|uniref:Uncharacterized protein n=1 Tax=Coptis chinensis TaxID=261450 RepID=A0A835IMC0_9MAGN|nr:hypothetical protein IFM89_024551 [Coptis chinensis]